MNVGGSEARGAVFLSYASQDAEAAKKICAALRAAGVEVWFDQSELIGGDAWDAKIRKQIRECALFVPVISANTQARAEGYFRREWKLAVERTHDMADHVAFLVPVVLDDTRDREAHVPEAFLKVQWTRLPGGETPPAFAERVRRLLKGGIETGAAKVGASLDGARGRRPLDGLGALSMSNGQGTPLRRSPARRWTVPAILGAIAVVALAVWRPWRSPNVAALPPPPVSPAAVSPARVLAAKARALFESTTPSRDDFALAENYCRQALKLDENDAEVWAAYAELSSFYFRGGYDTSPERHELARVQAERAVKLAPRSFEARFAKASYLRGLDGPALAEAEKILRELAAENPGDGRVLIALGKVIWGALGPGRNLARGDEALAVFARAEKIAGSRAEAAGQRGWLLFNLERYPEAEAAIDDSLRMEPSPTLMGLKITMAEWRGDLDTAEATLGRLPPDVLQIDVAVGVAAELWLLAREPDKCLATLSAFTRDYFSSNVYVGSVDGVRGDAYQLAGKTEAARNARQTALRVVERRLADQPRDGALLAERARLLALLGERDAAAQALRLYGEIFPNPNMTAADGKYFAVLAHVLLDPPDAAIALLEPLARAGGPVGPLRLDFRFDALRGNPRFEALLAAAPGATAKAIGPMSATAPDSKSIAVLPFVNMSPDKENEYLSDGLTEEILNALAQVPGLRVPARTSSFVFKGKTDDIRKIGELLHVGTVLEGSVQRVGNQLRITVQLINVADGYQVWSEKYDREMANIFAIQDDIARNIVDRLKVTWTDPANAASAKHRPQNIEAYELVLKGKEHADEITETELNLAIPYFKQAIAKQPDYAEAYAQLGRAYGALAREGFVSPDSVRAQKQAAFAKARELDNSLWEVQIATAEEAFWSSHDWVALERVYQGIVEQNPGLARVHELYALFLADLGRYSESLAEASKAQQLDPLSLNAKMVIGLVQLYAGNVDSALENSRQFITISPDLNFVARWIIIRVLWAKGQRAEAITRFEEALGRDPSPRGKAELGSMYGKVGRTAEAQKLLDEVLGEARQRYVPAFSIAQLYLGLGDAEQADAWMNKAIDSREAWVMAIKAYPDDSFRGCRYYPEWLKKIGLEP